MGEKEEMKQQAMNIIEKDEEIQKYLRKIAERFIKRGGRDVSCLSDVAEEIWKKQFCEIVKECNLNQAQNEFFEKVDRFMQHYSRELCTAYKQYLSNNVAYGYKKVDDTAFVERIGIVIKACYIILRKEEKVEQRMIVKYAAKYFDFKISLPITIDLHILNLFFTNKNFEKLENGLPAHGGVGITIRGTEKWKELKKQYRTVQSNSPTETAIYSQVFIEKFF